MITGIQDRTVEFAKQAQYNIDSNGYDYVIVHFIGLSGTVSFNGSNDSGATTGQTSDSALTATNWVAIMAENQNTRSNVSSISTGGIVKFVVTARYLQLLGTASTTVTKLLIYFAKIQ